MFNLGPPSAPIRQCCFPLQKLKLMSLSAQLERNRWQVLTSVCSGGTLSTPVPFQVDDRRSCNGWHGRAARQSRVRIPATDSFRAEHRNTSLKLCREADCTNCSAKHADTEGQTDAAQTRGNAGGNGCEATSCSASPCTDMPVQSFETNRHWAVFERI